MKDNKPAIGFLGFFGLVILLVAFTLVVGVNYPNLIGEIFIFLSGGVFQLSVGGNLFESIVNTLAIAIIGIFSSITLVVVSEKLAGSSQSHVGFEDVFAKGPTALFGIVTVEEVLARQIFLGLLTRLFPGVVAFYVLMLIGNLLWAALHLYNYDNEKERSLVRVLPQFVGGLLHSFVFYKYGFWLALLGHFTKDVILAAMSKKIDLDHKHWIVTGYYLAVTIAVMVAMGISGPSFSLLAAWVVGGLVPTTSLGFWEFTLLLCAVDSLIPFILGLIGLDSPSSKRRQGLAETLFGIGLAVLMLLGMNWALSFVIGEVFVRAAIIAVIMTLTAQTKSGSELTRAWFLLLPTVFLAVGATVSLGFWGSVGLFVSFFTLHWIPNLIRGNE